MMLRMYLIKNRYCIDDSLDTDSDVLHAPMNFLRYCYVDFCFRHSAGCLRMISQREIQLTRIKTVFVSAFLHVTVSIFPEVLVMLDAPKTTSVFSSNSDCWAWVPFNTFCSISAVKLLIADVIHLCNWVKLRREISLSLYLT